MSKGGRWGLVALAVAVVVAGFAIARPGDDEGEDGVERTVTAETQTERSPSPTATAPSAPEPPPDGPDAAVVELRGHAPDEVADIAVSSGERVRLVVRSDEPDDIHIHGYDLEQAAGPGQPARFSFRADIEGIFEIESHEAEHAGKDPLIARLVVEPS